MDRRAFLLASAHGLLLSRLAPAFSRSGSDGRRVPVTLVSNVGRVRQEVVNFGVPFAPGQLDDPSRLGVVDSRGREIPASVRLLEVWRVPPGVSRSAHEGSCRAVHVQFPIDLPDERPVRVELAISGTHRSRPDRFVPVAETLIDSDGLKGPRVLALLPSGWLCGSNIDGPQVPAQASGAWSGYNRFVDRSFPSSLQYIDSGIYHHWLFDRTSVYLTQYIRTGERRFLDAGYHCANFVRLHTATDGADAGTFTLKGPDVKYVYPRAMHLLYLLTGDERAREAGRLMARFCLTHWDPVYRPDRYVQPPMGVDPEKDRNFWSARHEAYGLLGVLHGWEMTGDEAYWRRALEYIDALASHQAQPPDGRPPDGSWRQNWALYDPNETLLAGGASPWMTAILLGALFHYWRITGDDRIPEMVTRWCDFLDRKGFIADGSRAHYVVDCFGSNHLDEAPGPQGQGMERHSTELACSFAMGRFFSRDAGQRARFMRRFEQLFEIALTIDANNPARCYNWAFQASSQLVYFMTQPPASQAGFKITLPRREDR